MTLPTKIGNGPPEEKWSYDPTCGFQLTGISTDVGIRLNTITLPVTVDPKKTALIIVDMQNYFLSTAMGAKRGPGHDAEDVLLSAVIPAARKAGIQIIHLTWGIAVHELPSLPPLLLRSFEFSEIPSNTSNFDVSAPVSKYGFDREVKLSHGIGEDLGKVKLPDGRTIQAGRMLMRGTWNMALHDRLQTNFDESQSSPLPDVRFHKCRISGLWGGKGPCLDYLKEKGIKTLLFSGVNTDQCVLASLQDACNMGYDTILIKDACGTDSPDYARQMVEYNCRKSWGFVSDSQALVDGVSRMK
ncbi:Isochorismatase-like protein [Naviculisporaceae sp. PSN 640]